MAKVKEGYAWGVEDVELYAWVGEDEFGSGEIGLKQGLVPAGMIPLVADTLESVDILTSCPMIIGDFSREMIRIITWEGKGK